MGLMQNVNSEVVKTMRLPQQLSTSKGSSWEEATACSKIGKDKPPNENDGRYSHLSHLYSFFYPFVSQDSELGGAPGDMCKCQDRGTYYISTSIL